MYAIQEETSVNEHAVTQMDTEKLIVFKWSHGYSQIIKKNESKESHVPVQGLCDNEGGVWGCSKGVQWGSKGYICRIGNGWP